MLEGAVSGRGLFGAGEMVQQCRLTLFLQGPRSTLSALVKQLAHAVSMPSSGGSIGTAPACPYTYVIRNKVCIYPSIQEAYDL